ncbi:MAG: DUF3581 domain-containing protein [Aquisalimonadaceae bacterium]
MFLDQFHSSKDGHVRITAEQASRFAKEVAGDFNPIHDPGAKRFCVPGDLLFSLVLARYGLSSKMTFSFKGMVGDGVPLRFPESPESLIEITDDAGRTCLQVERHGVPLRNAALAENLARHYVAFSGQNFPHFLKPLMAEQQVMFNPDRPLVIYESMSFDLQHLNFSNPGLELADSQLKVNGKRGDAYLGFRISADGEVVGTGFKKLVISGLRAYDEDRLQEFIAYFTGRRAEYLATNK